MEKVVLGRGLDALIGTGEKLNDQFGERIIFIPETSISKNTYQPRHRFDQKALDELKRSISEKGIIQPIIVQKRGNGYEVIAGERRLIAARLAGLKKIPSLVREITDKKDLLEIAIIENIQREDLNPVDRARSYRRLIDEFSESQEMIAERVGKDRSTISNTLRLLDLPEEVIHMIEEGRLNFGQARAILSINSREEQRRLALIAVDRGLSVRRIEQMVSRKKKKARPVKKDKDPHVRSAEDVLRESLKAKVSIVGNRKGGGKIEIEYFSEEELNRLCGMIGKNNSDSDAS
ncbi:MAG: ParB/RepB/Spo0J family partition protein [PVC group bacterium]